jgi:D-alanyl-D-alanine carboxypeptidase
MQALVRVIRHALVLGVLAILFALGGPALAAPYAAFVMDARNGEVLFARNHDTKLHPASLTKMMTLYVAFEAIRHNELSLDTMVTVSRRASATECVCLGLKPGQRISMRNLIRAAALRSANDAAVVIAEAVSGSVEDFGRRMTRTARAIGMNNSNFLNPHGLTQSGHISTARDMSILGRQLYFDYPEFFNIFSRRSEQAGVATVANTNRRFLDAYSGADGIKTGFTRAAGYNLTASARRGGKHIIATMFGGTTSAARNAHVAELMDIGFSKAKTRVSVRPPGTPRYQGRGQSAVIVAEAPPAAATTTERPAAAKTIRLQTAVRTSPRPRPRPERTDPALLAVVKESVGTAVAQITAAPPAPAIPFSVAQVPAVVPPPRPETLVRPQAAPEPEPVTALAAAQAAGFSIADPIDLAALEAPAAPEVVVPQPEPPVVAEVTPSAPMAEEPPLALADLADEPEPSVMWSGAADTVTLTTAPVMMALPQDGAAGLSGNVDLDVRPQIAEVAPPAPAPAIILTRAPDPAQPAPAPDVQAVAHVAEAYAAPGLEVVSRLSTSDAGRLWGVSLGEFGSRSAAERGLITVKMAEAAALGNGISRILQTGGRFEATFAGLTAPEAERACARLQARGMDCAISHP